jgi:hypothetical protein
MKDTNTAIQITLAAANNQICGHMHVRIRDQAPWRSDNVNTRIIQLRTYNILKLQLQVHVRARIRMKLFICNELQVHVHIASRSMINRD